jgi:ligand-binding sensor domain-containing protein
LNRWHAGQITTFFKTDGLPDDRVNAISLPRGSRSLFATPKGLCKFSQEALEAFEVPLPPPARTNLNCLHEDREGRLWLGGDSGLFRMPAKTANEPDQSLKVSDEAVLCLLERRDGGIWFGSRAGELGRVSPKANSPGSERLWRTEVAVTALCEDNEGNVWVGTAGAGLHRLKRRQLRLFPLPEAEGGSGWPCFFETPQGELRFVAGNKRVYRYQSKQLVALDWLPLPAGVAIQTVCLTPAGDYWMGTLRDGLFRYGAGVLRQFSERDGLSDSAIEALCAEEDGGLWIGTRNGGLNHFKNGIVTRFNTPWGFLGTHACALKRDAQGRLWIGTTGEGLFQLHNGRFTAHTEESGLPSNLIRALHADPDGSLWVGTAKGLCRVKEGRVATFAGGNVLSGEAILQLHSDGEGNLWIGSSSGIFRVSKAQLDAQAEGRARFVDLVPYGKEDGLPGVQCVPQIQSQAWRNAPEAVWFATTRGLVVVDRAARPWNRQPPPVVLEAVLVENVSVPFGGGVRVAPGKESLRFEYTALSLTAPGKVNFRYQLDGFDRDWSEPSTSRAARYPKVPPGNYHFRVVACNNDGVWNETGTSVAVTVVPFWWETFWFRLGVVGTAAAILAGLYRLRQARRRELERLRVRIASDLHDDIGSSLWSITLLSRMLAKHGNLAAEERQDVDEIHRIANQTSNSIRDIIWLINPAFDTVQDWLLRTKDFAGTVLRGVDYRMHCEGTDLSRKLPFDFRHNLFLLFKEALTNIARHAHASVVEVRIEEHATEWRLTIRDNGVGFDPAAATGGNGLRNLRARAAKMDAHLDIESRPGQGTTLILTARSP